MKKNQSLVSLSESLFVSFLFVLLLLPETAQALPNCHAYWHARKLGRDWPYHPPLDQFDDHCLSHLIVAKNLKQQCGVIRIKNEGRISLGIRWFDCKVNDRELGVGDVIELN